MHWSPDSSCTDQVADHTRITWLILHWSRVYHTLITWLSCTVHVAIMHCSRGWSYTDHVIDHALITWISCTDHVADHTLFTLVHSKGDQSWVFIGRTDFEAETPILWPPDAKSWLIGKDPDAGKDWEQEEKGTTEDEMVGWQHRLDGYGFGWTPGVGDGQGGLVCYGSWGCRVGHNWVTELTDWLSTSWHNNTLCVGCQQPTHGFPKWISVSWGQGLYLIYYWLYHRARHIIDPYQIFVEWVNS